MRFTSFALAMIAARNSVQAFESQEVSFTSKPTLVEQFKYWNCASCTLAFDGLDKFINSEAFRTALANIVVKTCTFSGLVPGGDEICADMADQYEPFLLDSVTSYLLDRTRMCNEVLGLCSRVHIEQIDLKSIVDSILATKPESLKSDDYINNLYAQVAADKNEREIIRAVHISDVHIDTEYMAGAKAHCGSMLCCRASEGMAGPEDIPAGEWGSNEGVCDIPAKTFISLMDYVVSDINPDLIFWTGDNSSHNIWSNTVEEVTSYTEDVTNLIKDAIKDTEITVVPIHGNHDTWPVDEQDFSEPNSNYAINHIKEFWSDWLTEEAKAKYGEYGYYSMDLKLKNGKGLPAGSRVIAYNTNVCDPLNFYVWGERSDPGHQFEWLEQTLAEIEADGGLAIMLGHYTPYNCQHQFGVRFRTLMDRYQDVVRFGLVGHTHKETYQLTNSMTNPEKPVYMTSVGGSVTTYDFMNPSFMVIDLDAATMLPINMHTYYIDVDEANQKGFPEWRELHDYRESYSMADLSPTNFKDLAVRIFTDHELATQFVENERRQNKNKAEKVNQLKTYCDLATSEQHENYLCNETGQLSAYGDEYRIASKHIAKALVDRIVGNWVDYSIDN